MRQFELAKSRLFDKDALNAKNIKMFPGSNRDATPEQFAEQLNKAISQIEAGDFDDVEFDD